MVTLSAPSALDAMAIPSTAVAFQGPGATGPAEAGNGQDSQSSFHQTYKDAEAEAATPAPPVSGRDSKDAAKKSTPAKDNVRNDNAAAVVPPPALTAEALARLMELPW